MIIKKITVGELQSNCYIVGAKSKKAVIIDPGAEYIKIKSTINRYKLKPVFIINTHGHIDHIGCNSEFGLTVYIHKEDRDFLLSPDKNLSGIFLSPLILNCETKILEDKEKLFLDEITLEVIHTPGHTPGSICLYLSKEDILFTGDTLFKDGIGRTDFPQSNHERLLNSIKTKLLNLPDRTKIFPGHGLNTTIGEEKKYNLFLCKI